ncbi:TPA: hypothetical protein M2Q89_000718 [Escherichia coli]|nr:hypothetical protein [Escherichia coli]
MKNLLDFTNHLNAMMEDEQTIEELFELYPSQHSYMMGKYKDSKISAYYLCLVHLSKEFQCEKFIVADEILSIKPELRAN